MQEGKWPRVARIKSLVLILPSLRKYLKTRPERKNPHDVPEPASKLSNTAQIANARQHSARETTLDNTARVRWSRSLRNYIPKINAIKSEN